MDDRSPGGLNVLAVQFDIRWEDKPANYDRVRRLIRSASPAPGSLIVLPEMFATGFSMNVAGIAEPPGGPAEQLLSAMARDYKAFVMGGLVGSRPDGRGANQAVAFDPQGREIARYTKLHPFTHAGEDKHYARGEVLVTFDAAGLTVAQLICYDLRFPEAFRAGVRAGVDCFVVIANWPAARADHWRALLIARAIENQAYVIGVNRVGADPNRRYAGGSMIVDAWGNVISEAADREGVVSAPLDPEQAKAVRNDFPVLRDILPAAAYSGAANDANEEELHK